MVLKVIGDPRQLHRVDVVEAHHGIECATENQDRHERATTDAAALQPQSHGQGDRREQQAPLPPRIRRWIPLVVEEHLRVGDEQVFQVGPHHGTRQEESIESAVDLGKERIRRSDQRLLQLSRVQTRHHAGHEHDAERDQEPDAPRVLRTLPPQEEEQRRGDERDDRLREQTADPATEGDGKPPPFQPGRSFRLRATVVLRVADPGKPQEGEDGQHPEQPRQHVLALGDPRYGFDVDRMDYEQQDGDQRAPNPEPFAAHARSTMRSTRTEGRCPGGRASPGHPRSAGRKDRPADTRGTGSCEPAGSTAASPSDRTRYSIVLRVHGDSDCGGRGRDHPRSTRHGSVQRRSSASTAQ